MVKRLKVKGFKVKRLKGLSLKLRADLGTAAKWNVYGCTH